MAFKDYSVGVNIVGHDSVSGVLEKMGKNAKKTESTMHKVGKNISRAFNVAAASAVAAGAAFAVSAVKGAIEDEKATAILTKTLKNNTKATDAQIKAVDEYISKTQISTGILDDDLRPSLDRLVRSTHSITKAQKLQALAMDISAGTGKPLQAVSEALGKAYDGNFTALKRLGIKIDAATMKSKDFSKVQKSLVATFDGQLKNSLNTTAGKLSLMNARWDDMREKLGYVLLDGLQPIMDWASGPEGQAFLSDFMEAFKSAALATAKALPDILSTMKKIGAAASSMGINFDMLLDPRLLAAGVAFKMTPGPVWFKAFAAAAAYVATTPSQMYGGNQMGEHVGGRNTAFPIKKQQSSVDWSKLPGGDGGWMGKLQNFLFGTDPQMATGGVVTRPTRALVGEAGPEAIIPLNRAHGFGTTVIINVEGSVIAEKDLIYKVRNGIAQTMRRQSVGTAAFGV